MDLLLYVHKLLLANHFNSLGQHMLYWFNSQSNSPGTNYGKCVHIFAHGQWIRSASHQYVHDTHYVKYVYS